MKAAANRRYFAGRPSEWLTYRAYPMVNGAGVNPMVYWYWGMPGVTGESMPEEDKPKLRNDVKTISAKGDAVFGLEENWKIECMVNGEES